MSNFVEFYEKFFQPVAKVNHGFYYAKKLDR